jgi:2-iminobutanoate/2-iminopropanoate deaminase
VTIIVLTTKAPAAIGPYSQAIKAGNLLFTSGQIPIDPATGKLAGETIEMQTTQAMNNIVAIVTEAGGTVEQIVKTTIFIQDMNDFPVVNRTYEKFFAAGRYPARSCVEVSRLPKDVLVEIEAIACIA